MPSTYRECAGLLNTPVTLESPGETSGDAVVTWTLVATVWANVTALGGSESSGLLAEANYHFRLRYRSDITPRWRLGVVTGAANRKFNIISVQDPDGRSRDLIIMAREIV